MFKIIISEKIIIQNSYQRRIFANMKECASYNTKRFEALWWFGVEKIFANLFWYEQSNEWFESILKSLNI